MMRVIKPAVLVVVRELRVFCLMGMLLGVMAYPALAAELSAGAIITKENLDRIKNDTFERKTVASMVKGTTLEWQIKNWGLQIKLRHSEIVPIDSRFVEATKKYGASTKFNPDTGECSGYMAGLAFPDISPDDPYAGNKVIWNAYYGQITMGNTQYYPHSHVLIGDRGLERVQRWFWLRYYMKGNLARFAKGLSPVEGDGSILTKTLLFATYPNDIRGIGVFVIRWDLPKVEDQWAYIKSVRRTRRLSGGAWMDPVGATDVLQDDIACWSGRPSWYTKIRLLGRRWVLAGAHVPDTWNEARKGALEEFPAIDLATWPHWNPSPKKVTWEPREVWVIEGTPPAYHPYSKRIVYADVHVPVLYFAECYDKAGNFWKFINYEYMPVKGMDGYDVFIPPYVGHYIDFKRRHASVHYMFSTRPNDPAITADDVTLGQLEAAGK